jgi:hypothetical protein
MRKIAALIGVILASLTLSSCIKMDINLVVNKDATVSGYTIFAFAESLAELGGDQSTSPADDLINTEAEGVTVSKYEKDGFVGQKYSFSRVPFSEFSKSEAAKDELTFVREGNTITVIGALDLSNEDDGGSADEFGAEWAKSIMASAELDVRITFPGKVIKSTGTISADGRTVSWKPEIGEKLDLATTVELPNPSALIMPLAGIALVLAIGGVILFVKAKRKKNEESGEVVVDEEPAV